MMLMRHLWLPLLPLPPTMASRRLPTTVAVGDEEATRAASVEATGAEAVVVPEVISVVVVDAAVVNSAVSEAVTVALLEEVSRRKADPHQFCKMTCTIERTKAYDCPVWVDLAFALRSPLEHLSGFQ
jgi:hypothetical protein